MKVSTLTRPFVSVIMPVRNEGSFIKKSLGALLCQTYPKDRFEIIIADGMSSDNTRKLIGSMSAQSDISIKIVENPKRIAPTGLNLGLKEAKGEIIVRVDGHTVVDKTYIAECVGALLRTGSANAGGKMNAISFGAIGNSISRATSSRFGIGNARFHFSDLEEYADTVYLGAWPRRIFDQYGWFNEELVRNQDDEFNYRLRANGEKLLLSPLIRSKYYSRSTFWSLWRQYFQYGYWKVRVLQMHPKQMSVRQFVPFFFVLSVLLLGALSIIYPPSRLVLGAVIFSYLAANLIASIWAAGRDILLIPYIALSYCILHVSYGLGSIAGMVAFRNRWKDLHGASFSAKPDGVPSKS